MKIPKRILERRRSIRIDEVLPFKIGHAGYSIETETVNISAHGVMCRIDREIPMMTRLDIALQIPNAKAAVRHLKMKGVVVRKEADPHSDKFFIAIYFSRIGEADQKVLNDFIEARVRP